MPVTLVRLCVVTHCTRTHGLGTIPRPTGIWNGQPAMANVSVASASGAPATIARVFADTMVTLPPCGHVIELVVVSEKPAITSP
jgi:hypothetical protein